MRNQIRASLLVATGIAIGLVVPVAWSAVGTQAQTQGCQTFPQTGYQVCGRFLTYWQQHGGLAQQGYPISAEFTETSALNGKPYTVQYFERAVFEYHPENKAPNDVLLSQLGTYLGKDKYTQGFPKNANDTPFYEDRTSPEGGLLSFYNAINRKEYQRAYGYFDGAPNPPASLAAPYDQWVKGYADTTSVTVAYGKINTGAAAGSIYATMPVVLTAKHTDGSTHVYAGCYTMRRTNEGMSPDPQAVLWRVYMAKLSEVPSNSNIDNLLAQNCSQ
jgi:hypothetical protein